MNQFIIHCLHLLCCGYLIPFLLIYNLRLLLFRWAMFLGGHSKTRYGVLTFSRTGRKLTFCKDDKSLKPITEFCLYYWSLCYRLGSVSEVHTSVYKTAEIYCMSPYWSVWTWKYSRSSSFLSTRNQISGHCSSTFVGGFVINHNVNYYKSQKFLNTCFQERVEVRNA